MDVNPVAKIISRAFHQLSIDSNNLLLSGILDVENIIAKHSLIREELEKEDLWKTVNKQFQYITLDKKLFKFIIDIQQDQSANIPECESQSLFSNTRDLVKSMLRLWRISEYTIQSSSINKSTWEHDILDPIVKYITYNLEEDIFMR
ncbi:2589_t:CDS:2, partial [Racocetra persica]